MLERVNEAQRYALVQLKENGMSGKIKKAADENEGEEETSVKKRKARTFKNKQNKFAKRPKRN